MTVKRKGLGRSLDELLSTTPQLASEAVVAANDTRGESAAELQKIVMLGVECLQRGKYQPRKDMNIEALEELASSIRTQGLLQPVVVRPITDNRYEIIAGERRWRAVQMAELEQIPAIVKDVSDEQAMALALIENIQRENLNPMEEAIALQRLLDEFGMTHQKVAEAVGKSRSAVTNLLRLNSLHPDVRVFLERGDITLGHAKVLLALEGADQLQAARQISAKNLSVREAEVLIRHFLSPAKELLTKKTVIDPDVRHLQVQLSERLGAKVKIDHTTKGKGKLVIHYSNLDELDEIVGHIN